MLLAAPFIQIEGKEKSFMTSICDKKGNLVKSFINRQEI